MGTTDGGDAVLIHAEFIPASPPAVSAPCIAIFTNWFYTCYDPESEDWFREDDFHNQLSNIPHQEAVAVDMR